MKRALSLAALSVALMCGAAQAQMTDGVVKIARRDGEESISVVEAEAFEVEER